MPDIDNLTFFRIIDKQVRKAMQEVEVKLLPIARQALDDTGLILHQYPVEGYYGKSKELTDYFNHIRTLQLNFSDKVTDSVRQLYDFYTNEVFGLGQAVRTAVNEKCVWFPREQPAVISPMVDPLTVAINTVADTPSTVHQDLTIKNITQELEGIGIGNGLVGFGSLVDKIERGRDGEYNPIATTLARETTVLSAYVPTMKCISQYLVSPEVESHGNVVINAYNSLFSSSGLDVNIPNITRKNAFSLNNDLPDMNRCVRIFNLALPGNPIEFYHWAISGRGNGLKVVDFWRKEVVTTDMFKKSPEKYQ